VRDVLPELKPRMGAVWEAGDSAGVYILAGEVIAGA
jgi:hypothetical protein